MGAGGTQGEVQEAVGLRERGLALALEHDLTFEALRTYNNLADIPLQRDRFHECLALAELCKQARLDHIKGKRFDELMQLLALLQTMLLQLLVV